ncbi:MAG: hypothetical protein HOV80_09560 [Polyangiaceae bacterium]|nr:hypothetical protein [Polyangiaceae bacterium]
MLHPRGALAALLVISLPTAAQAGTWIDGQTTPDVEELVVVDPTGEEHWLYGREDVAGDGEGFGPAEQGIDIRSGYAAGDATRFFARAYVSSEAAPPPSLVVYVFIDSDRNLSTGGSSASPEIDPRFTIDPGGGGFEHCFAVRANGTVHGLWHYSDVTNAFQPENLLASEAAGEPGVDIDPMLLGAATHGYLQGSIKHDKVGTAAACNARLYFRSLDVNGSGPSDADVGDSRPCASADVNSDGIPDVLVPNESCESDDDCPFFGICDDGTKKCLVGDPCDATTDCPADRACEDGRCVVAPAGPCGTSANCKNGMVCEQGTCVACANDAECGVAGRCSQDGRCIAGGEPPAEEDEGCGCVAVGKPESARLAAAVGLALAVAALRRRRSNRARA